ncbi:hypothetical protein KK083_23620 [Fulvivirgaceae bacterium PWU4]|uniref:Uncharacterized protein n=1 Tax=Chryseosolibacter histidini TaxID=2782349 RepID=A0AAP2DP54_9BACT|nr:hypothetical protein [Chryseosolibacter histidini]MBT1699896.1 hypothetical protein [Chryseosolibacter histidini]
MIYDIISYIVIGGLFAATIIPLIALLRQTIKEQRELDEAKNSKKMEPHQLKTESYVFSSAKS